MRKIGVTVAALMLLASSSLHAQWRVGSDSASRWTRFGRDMVYGVAEGLAFAGVDQARNQPPQWGKGWNGYGKRAASNVGEFVIQEGVTEGLAAALRRPLDYSHCRCTNTFARAGWAIGSAFVDRMPDGSHPLAIPRIVGAYAGSFAQASWRPDNATDRTRTALVNGTMSMVIGAGINLWYEFRKNIF